MTEKIKNLFVFLHAQADSGIKLTDLGLIEVLGRNDKDVLEFLSERCQKGDSAFIAKNFNQFGLYSDKRYLLLAETLKNGYPAENIPVEEYVTRSSDETHRKLLDAVVKQGKGEVILAKLHEYALSLNSQSYVQDSYDYIVEKMNKKLFGKKVPGYAHVFASVIAENERNQQESTAREIARMKGFANALNEQGAEAFKLFSIRTKDISHKPDIHIGTYDLDRCPEFVPAATRVFKTETAKGLKEALNCAQIVPAICWKEETVNGNKRGRQVVVPEVAEVVKKFPPMLRAIDSEFPIHDEISPLYCDLAKAAVTNPDFDWKDLNIKRLNKTLYRDGKYLYFDEQMNEIVASAQSGGGKVPAHFASYVKKGGSGKNIYSCKGD